MYKSSLISSSSSDEDEDRRREGQVGLSEILFLHALPGSPPARRQGTHSDTKLAIKRSPTSSPEYKRKCPPPAAVEDEEDILSDDDFYVVNEQIIKSNTEEAAASSPCSSTKTEPCSSPGSGDSGVDVTTFAGVRNTATADTYPVTPTSSRTLQESVGVGLEFLLVKPELPGTNNINAPESEINFADYLADANGYIPAAANPTFAASASTGIGDLFRTPDTKRKRTAPVNVLKLEEEQLEVSFHKINVSKFPPNCTEETIINYIIEKYNDPTKMHKKYDEETVTIPPHIDDEHEASIFEGEQFQTRVFVLAAQEPISFLSAYGIKRFKQLIHQVIFHFRRGEIFAITAGSGFHVVQWISDFDFPSKFAARLLSEKGLLESTKKGIVGTESTHRRTHKSEQEANPFDLLEFCTTYTAEIRNRSSLLQLGCFQNKRMHARQQQLNSMYDDNLNTQQPGSSYDLSGTPSGRQSFSSQASGTPGTPKLDFTYNALKRVKVVVSISSIRIRRPLHPCDLPSILSIMSKISKGEPTYDLDGELEKDSTAHLKYVSLVHSEVAAELDVILGKMFRAAIANDEKLQDLEDFALSHKLYTNFTNGFDFSLQYKKTDVMTWSPSPPTWIDVVRMLRTTTLPKISPLECNDETFAQYLTDFKLSYEVKGSGFINRKPEKMFNYLEGFLYRKEDCRLYWHVHSNWCYVKEVYLVLVHSEFAGVMKSSLKNILTEDPMANEQLGFLFRNTYLTNEQVEGMTDRYKTIHENLPEFFIPTLPSHDLFDMVKISEENGKNFLRMYFMVPSLDHRSLSKGIQITNSLLQIKKAALSTSGRKNAVGGTERIWKKVQAIHKLILNRPMFKNACKDVKTFLEMLASAEIRLIIGRCAIRSAGNVRSLDEESKIPTRMAVVDIRKKFEDLCTISSYMAVQVKQLGNLLGAPVVDDNCAPLAVALHEALIQQGYIDNTSSVTGKLLGQNKKLFDFTAPDMNSTTREFIYDELIGPLRPQSISFLARLAIVRVHRELQSFGCKQFSVVELIHKI